MSNIPCWSDVGEIDCITFRDVEGEGYCKVGYHGCTSIEKYYKEGLHSNIPYVIVWHGKTIVLEFCQHSLIAVSFKKEEM